MKTYGAVVIAVVIIWFVVWASVAFGQNYRVLDRVQIGSDTDQATVIFDVLQSRQVTYRFRVHCPNDVILDVTVVQGPNSVAVQRITKVQDPNGWMWEYEFIFTPVRGTVYVDITATDTTGICQPVILKGKGLAQIPYWLPHGPAYVAGRKDAGKIWQDSMAAATDYAGHHIPTERQKNDGLYLAWTQGKVVKP